ncbi:Hypothetical protein A7982_02138 [Minicystis rosea]|nr:Hypothetical protein A7982_02138 [Minicystis rosea]
MPTPTFRTLTVMLSCSAVALAACTGDVTQETTPDPPSGPTATPATGALLWSRTYGEGWDDSGTSLVLTNEGNARFLGSAQLDGSTDPAETRQLLMEVDGDGNLVRRTRIGPSSAYQVGLGLEAVGVKGEHVVTGGFANANELAGCSLVGPAGYGGELVATLDAEGACLWATTFGAQLDFSSLDVSPTGEILIAGVGKPGASLAPGVTLPVPEEGGARFHARYSPAGKLLSVHDAGGPALPIARFDHDGGIILYAHPHIARIDAQDATSWSWELKTPGWVHALVVAGPTVVMGTWESSQLTLRSLHTNDGSEAWEMPISGASDTDLGPIGLGGSDGGNVVLAAHLAGGKTISLGATKLTGTGKDNLFWALIDGSGSVLRSQVVPVDGTIYASEAATDAAGDVWVLGTFTGGVDFGDGFHAGHPVPPPVKPLDLTGYDVFLARYH